MCSYLLTAHAHRVLIGACKPTVCPIYASRSVPDRLEHFSETMPGGLSGPASHLVCAVFVDIYIRLGNGPIPEGSVVNPRTVLQMLPPEYETERKALSRLLSSIGRRVNCSVGTGGCAVEPSILAACPASCSAANAALNRTSHLACDPGLPPVVTSLFLPMLKQIKAKHEPQVVAAGSTSADSVPWPSQLSPTTNSMAWLNPENTNTSRPGGGGGGGSGWAQAFTRCGLTGVTYQPWDGNVTFYGLSQQDSVDADSFYGDPSASWSGWYQTPVSLVQNTAGNTLHVVNYRERSPHFFDAATTTRCRVMDACRREWSYLQRSMDLPGTGNDDDSALHVPIGYTVSPGETFNSHAMPGIVQIQCYFPTNPILGGCAQIDGSITPDRLRKQNNEMAVGIGTTVNGSASKGELEWVLFYVAPQPDEANLDNPDNLRETVFVTAGIALLLLLALAFMERDVLFSDCIRSFGVPLPLNLSDHRRPHRKYLTAGVVMGMFIFREGLDTAYGIKTQFEFNDEVGIYTVIIFAALVAPEMNSNMLGGAATGVAYSGYLLSLVVRPLALYVGEPDVETDLPQYHTLGWTSSMSIWVILVIVLSSIMLWYLFRLGQAMWMRFHPNGAQQRTYDAEAVTQLNLGGHPLAPLASLAYTDAHVSVLLQKRIPRSGASIQVPVAHRTATYEDSDDSTAAAEGIGVVDGDDGEGGGGGGRDSVDLNAEDGDGTETATVSCSQLLAGCRNVIDATGNSFTQEASACLVSGWLYFKSSCVGCCCTRKPKPKLSTLEQSRLDAFRFSPRLYAAVAASVSFIILATVKAIYGVQVYFAEGVLRCALSFNFGDAGLGEDRCEPLGPCGTWARTKLLTFADDMSSVPFTLVGFPCETPNPFPDVGRPRGFLLLCKTVDLVVAITSNALAIAVAIGMLVQLLMLRGMLRNHRDNILKLRSGDWSPVPPKLKAVSPGYSGSNMLYFVVFVWLSSSIGLIIFMTIAVLGTLGLTIPVLALVPSLTDGDINIFSDDDSEAILNYLWGALVKFLIVPLIMVLVNVLVVNFVFTSGTKHHVISRNRGFYFWWETFSIILLIPLVLTKYISRFGKAVFSVLTYMSRADVSLMVKGEEHKDPAYVAYVSFLLNDHAISNPVLISFCRMMLETRRVSSSESPARFTKRLRPPGGSINGCEDESYDDDELLLVVDLARDTRSGAGRRVRTRWCVLVTLSNNPALIELRKHHLATGGQKKKGILALSFELTELVQTRSLALLSDAAKKAKANLSSRPASVTTAPGP